MNGRSLSSGSLVLRENVTFLLPIRNGEKWVLDILSDIVAMSQGGDEIIAVDDGSTDKTLIMLNKFKSQMKLTILNSQGRGLVEALNLGITESNTEWIARVDVDDKHSPLRIEEQMKVIQEDTVAVFSDYEIVSEEDRSLGVIYSPIFDIAIKLAILRSERIAHPSALLRKSAVLKAGGYLKSEFPCEDLGLWIRLSKLGSFSSISSTHLRYRLISGSVSTSRYQDAKEKTKLLTSGNYPKLICQDITLKEISNVLKHYKELPDSAQRQVLFLRDILNPKLKTYLGTKMRMYSQMRLLLLLIWPGNFYCIFEMIYYRAIRRIYRNKIGSRKI